MAATVGGSPRCGRRRPARAPRGQSAFARRPQSGRRAQPGLNSHSEVTRTKNSRIHLAPGKPMTEPGIGGAEVRSAAKAGRNQLWTPATTLRPGGDGVAEEGSTAVRDGDGAPGVVWNSSSPICVETCRSIAAACALRSVRREAGSWRASARSLEATRMAAAAISA